MIVHARKFSVSKICINAVSEIVLLSAFFQRTVRCVKIETATSVFAIWNSCTFSTHCFNSR